MSEPDPFSPGLLDNLQDLPIEEVRARRTACQAIETELSYVRRLAQGRLDIVAYEVLRRKGETGASGDVVAGLTEALGTRVVAPGLGHLPTVIAPGEVDPALLAKLDEVAPPGRLSEPQALSDEDLRSYAGALAGYERELSDRRRAMFDRIDALQAEIVRRYQSGEASVDSLLGS